MRILLPLLATFLSVVAFAEIAYAKGPNKYCEGHFEPNKKQCAKFQFGQVRDDQRCNKSNDNNSDQNGIQLANCTTFYHISNLPDETMDDHASKMAQLITNVFENGSTKMGYAAVQKLGDCRGFTCGYIGFTTGTNDAYAVVYQYTKRKPDNPLKKYLKELERLSQLPFGSPGRDNTAHLEGFDTAWKQAACEDAEFVQTQLDVGDAMYLKPALKYAASAGVKSNLGKALFYDTIVQHGWQYVEPKINLPRILELTGPKDAKECEKAYLTRFLTTRRQLVCCYPGDVWNESSDRMSDLQNLVDDWEKNKDLENPVHLQIYGATIKGTEDMSYDSDKCSKPPSTKATAKDLPVPDTCPNPLLS